MRLLFIFAGYIIIQLNRICSFLVRKYETTKFSSFGYKSYIGKDCVFSYPNISIGNHTFIGSKCVIQSAHGNIIIGNHVMLGAGAHIHGGNHIINRKGVYMNEIKKEKETDGYITIEDDVWIGSNAIILGGAEIG